MGQVEQHPPCPGGPYCGGRASAVGATQPRRHQATVPLHRRRPQPPRQAVPGAAFGPQGGRYTAAAAHTPVSATQ